MRVAIVLCPASTWNIGRRFCVAFTNTHALNKHDDEASGGGRTDGKAQPTQPTLRSSGRWNRELSLFVPGASVCVLA